MTHNTFKPNVQLLQADVVNLLGQISSLMHRASAALGYDSMGKKYDDFRKQIDEERRKVADLELVMAIVAPMKAGKSTIINAIIGQDLLPSRNAAMTTLPTEIVLKSEISQPTLTLSSEIIRLFQNTLTSLQRKIDQHGIKWAQERLNEHPHLMELLENIRAGIWGFLIREKTVGREEIVKTLTALNDVIRLCTLIEPSVDPLRFVTDVPKIETPFLRSQLTPQSERMGNLVIIDTPGPNEAGEHLKLANVVAEQLQRSSIVLIVLDFTQLKTKAAEEVKQDVQRVIDLRGKETLYVLVNKVDQRTDNDMNTEQVKQFVAAQFGIGGFDDTERVFEIAARWAFSATNVLLEMQQHPQRDIAQMQTAQALAQQAFGALWKKTLQKANAEQMQMAAQEVWELSGFAPFIDKAINALMESAAPRCMRSGLRLSRSLLVQLGDDVKLRRSAIASNAGELKRQIEALEEDLRHLEICRNRLKQVDAIKAQLQRDINSIINRLSSSKPPYEVLQEFSRDSKTFNYSSDATKFQENVDKKIIEKLNVLIDETRDDTTQLINKARRELTTLLERETQPIIERAKKRLNQAFSINLSFTPPKLGSSEIGFINPSGKVVKAQTREWTEYKTEYQTRYERRWYTLWLWEHEMTVPITKSVQKSETYYVISKSDVVDRFNNSIKDNVKKVQQKIDQYLREDFQNQIDAFFQNLDKYLGSYRDSLRQAQNDQKLQSEKKDQLIKALESLVPEANEKISKADAYLKQTDNLM